MARKDWMQNCRHKEREGQELWTVAFIVLALIALAFGTGCKQWNPVAVEDHSLEQFAAVSWVLTQCKVLGVEPRVEVTHDVYCVDVEPGYEDTLSFEDTFCPSSTRVPAAAWASNGTVWVWNESVNLYSQETQMQYARHECCHVYLGHEHSTAEVEAEADRCVVEMFP